MNLVIADSAVLLRAFVSPPAGASEDILQAFQQSADLLRGVARGEVQLALSDAVVAEIIVALSSPRHFGLSREETASRLRVVLSHPGVRIAARPAMLAALDRWAREPGVGFSRALTVQRAVDLGAGLVLEAEGPGSHRRPVALAEGEDGTPGDRDAR